MVGQKLELQIAKGVDDSAAFAELPNERFVECLVQFTPWPDALMAEYGREPASLSNARSAILRALNLYRECRERPSLASHRTYDTIHALFGFLWNWRSVCTSIQIDSISKEIASIYQEFSRSDSAVCRPEFAFMVAWSGGIAWIEDWPSDFVDLKHGSSEILEVLRDGAVANLRVLLGADIDDDFAWCNRRYGPYDWSASSAAVTNSVFGHYVVPSAESITRQLLQR